MFWLRKDESHCNMHCTADTMIRFTRCQCHTRKHNQLSILQPAKHPQQAPAASAAPSRSSLSPQTALGSRVGRTELSYTLKPLAAVPARPSSAELGMDVAELSVTAELLQRSESTEAQAAAAAAEAGAESLYQQPWVQALVASHQDCKLVFSADGNAAEARQHLSTGLSQDHLFLSLLESNMIRDMVVLYAAERKIVTVLQLGVPVCGHPTIVHGGLISAIFDETFGVLLYAAGRWGHFDLSMVFTARLEVDYKKPLPAESTIVCEATVESMEGRKIWLNAQLTDETGGTVYAASRALFVKPKQPVSLPQPDQPQQQQ